MARTKWFYYVHEEGNVILAIAKANSDAFEWRLGKFGFQPCTHAEWLTAKKAIHEREQQVEREGEVSNGNNE